MNARVLTWLERQVALGNGGLSIITRNWHLLLVLPFNLLNPSPASSQEATVNIVQSEFRVPPGQRVCFERGIASYLVNARFLGPAVASGGANQDIRILIIKDQRVVLYDSGPQHNVQLNVPIDEPGKYAICFDNGFSVVASKAVRANINLVHEGTIAARLSAAFSPILQEAFGKLNRDLRLPAEVSIQVTSCGKPNAQYVAARRQVTLCTELIERFISLFRPFAKSSQELGEAVGGATIFVTLHELGHALIHVLDLPVAGREEDAADQIATWFLLQSGEQGERAALNASAWFRLEGVQMDVRRLPYWDEHSLNLQRFYNITCWIYGKSPSRYGWVVERGLLPQGRAERCPGEYEKMARSYMNLLGPHMVK